MKVSESELELGIGLIDRLTSEEFNPDNYNDEYRIRVLGMLDEKSEGKEIVIGKAQAPKRIQVVDIMEGVKAEHGTDPSQKETRHGCSDKEEKKSVIELSN